MEDESLPNCSYNRIAFKVQDQDFEQYGERVRSLNIEIREGRNRIEAEGRSLYFYDYDNHLFEIHKLSNMICTQPLASSSLVTSPQ